MSLKGSTKGAWKNCLHQQVSPEQRPGGVILPYVTVLPSPQEERGPSELSFLILFSPWALWLNEKGPTQPWTFEHFIPSWWHRLGRFTWYSLVRESLSMEAGFESLKPYRVRLGQVQMEAASSLLLLLCPLPAARCPLPVAMPSYFHGRLFSLWSCKPK